MLKGFIVLFTLLISYFMFKRKFTNSQYLGVVFVISGLLVVGSSNIKSYNSKFAPRPFLGNILVIIAQMFLAGMFVYEEMILKDYKVKVLEIVGWEGVWGVLLTTAFLFVFYLIPGDDYGSAENPIQATYQLFNNKNIFISIIVSSFVIGPFNYYGTSLTKHATAMHRCLVDASRMCIVWIISMCCGWESFQVIQAWGYMLIILGNLLYSEIFDLNNVLLLVKRNTSKLDFSNNNNTLKSMNYTLEYNIKNITNSNKKYDLNKNEYKKLKESNLLNYNTIDNFDNSLIKACNLNLNNINNTTLDITDFSEYNSTKNLTKGNKT